MTPFARGCVALLTVMACASTARAQTMVVTPTGAGTFVAMPDTPARDATGPQTGTGRIRGRVVDAETGAPLMDALMRLSGGGLRESPSAGTDEDGRFEFENLPAGRFSLSANKPGYMMLSYGQRRPFESGRPIELSSNQTLENIDFAVPRGGVIVVRVTDENGDPFSGVRIQAQRFRFAGGQRTLVPVSGSADATDDRGEVRVFGLPPGEYYVTTAVIGVGGAATNGTSYVPTHYPGTTAIDSAEKVAVQVGREIQINFPLVAARLARISGVVRRADGSPAARSNVTIVPRTPMGGGLIRSAAVQADGTFAIPGVPPGEYQIQAGFGAQADRELGRTFVTVAGKDLTGVTLAMATGGTVRGTIVFEPQAPASFRYSTLQLMVTGSTAAPAQDNGTFMIQGVFGEGLVRLLSPPAGWFLKEVRLNGKDITEVPIAVESRSELSGVDIVLTQKRATLGGSAVDGKGTPVSDYAVVLFSEDRSKWTLESRFIATARPDQQGRFRIVGMPPGKYLAAAVDYLETGTERDPDLLGRLREGATAVTLVEGESSTVMLSVQ